MKNLAYIFFLICFHTSLFATTLNNGDNPTPEKKTMTIKRGTSITLQLMDDVNSLDMVADNTVEMMVLSTSH